jgi:hypothetical protein
MRGVLLKILLALFCFWLSSFSAFALREVNDLEKDLFLMKVQNTIIQNNEFIRLAIANELSKDLTEKPEILLNEDPSELIELIEKVTRKHLAIEQSVRFGEKFREYFIDIGKETRSIIRTQGISIGVMFVVIEASQILGGIALAGTGHPEVGAVIGAFPFNEVLIIGTVALRKVISIRETYKAYGGKENYQFFKRIHKQVSSTLKTKKDKGIVIPYSTNERGQLDALSLSKLGFWSKLVSRMSPRRNKLDLITLKRFLKDNNLKARQEINDILKQDVEDALKITFLVNFIRKNEPVIFEELKFKFRKNFIEVSPFELSSDLVNWSIYGLSAETQAEFVTFAKTVPTQLRVLDAIKIWTKCLFPVVLDESSGLGYRSYRSLVKTLPPLEIASEVHFKESWSENWTKIFSGYFETAFN